MNAVDNIPDTVKLEEATCPLCGPSQNRFVLTGHDNLHDLPGKFTIVECTSCELKRTSPRPSANTIGYYYPDDYGPYVSTIVTDAAVKNTDLKSRLIVTAKKVFDTKAWALPRFDQPGSMLEVGCASGNFLHFMAQKGWRVEGIEFSDDAATTARKLGYRVDSGAVENIEKQEEYFDLVVGWMVIEHLHDPVSSLKKMAKWAKPSGKLAISVPNAGSAEFALFGSRWYALQLPTHLFHYDTKSITQVLNAAGWKVTHIHHHRTIANAIASFGYLLRDKGLDGLGQKLIDFPERGGRLGALLLFPISFLFALLGQTGRMTIWAEKKPS